MFSATDLFAYIRAAKLGVVSTLGPSGAPQSALVGIGVTEDLRIVFDTVSTSRKHANLVRDPRISLVIAGPAEKTLQYEGVASEIPVGGDEGREVREAYYASWPDGRERAVTWPTLRYWQIEPHWARYTDYDAEVLHAYFFGARPA